MDIAGSSDIAWKGYGLRGHRYRVSIEHRGTPRDGMARQPDLVFEAETQDEIIALVQRIRAGGACNAAEAAMLGNFIRGVDEAPSCNVAGPDR